MLSEICSEIKNYFSNGMPKYVGDITISNGVLEDCGLQEDQYYRIIGSVFNDGVHKHPADDLHDEVFNGAVWHMAVPKEVIDLATEIEQWNAKYGGTDSAALSPFQSESFGGYSYTKGSSESGGSGWKSAFGARLNKWRKIRP